MTDQINTVNVYDEARKALAQMALEAKDAAVIATGPENIKAIAALVDAQDARIDAQDAQIASIREYLDDVGSRFTLSDHCGELDYLIDDAKTLLQNTAEAAKAYEARIVAETIERCARVVETYCSARGQANEFDVLGARFDAAFDELPQMVRAMVER